MALNDFASQFKKGMKVEDMANELDITTNKALLQMNLPPNHVVVQHIVANKSINADKILLLGLSEDQVQELVQRNIFWPSIPTERSPFMIDMLKCGSSERWYSW